ncbi:MAG: hypothetical protein HY040_18920 [Planctomycetes bacterium]|nr:hypothetical protein [Planctomycetota bacterium]
MHVIFNSDVLYSDSLYRDSLGKRIVALLSAIAEKKYPVTIPLTTLLEFERAQEEAAKKERQSLKTALRTLERYGITIAEVDTEKLVKVPDLKQLMERLGVSVHVEEPGLEDFKTAHKRACRHEAPHTGSKSDEMRDLTIWAMAIRIAREKGGAMLVSKDKIHTGSLGAEEAGSAFLIRANSPEDALGYLGVITPAWKLLNQMLAPASTDLRAAGLPVGERLASVVDATFTQGENGPVRAQAQIAGTTEDGKKWNCRIDVSTPDGYLASVKITELVLDGEKKDDVSVSIEPPKQVFPKEDYSGKLSALMRRFGG